MSKAKEPELVDPEHELNPDVYRAPEPVFPDEPIDEPVPADEPAAETPTDG